MADQRGERIKIVTDSLAWLPEELTKRHDITVVPLHVQIAGGQYTETVDLTNERFYELLGQVKDLPKTSAPSPGEFEQAYRHVAEEADAILSVHFTSKMSATYQSAVIAAQALRDEKPDLRIKVLDTQQAAMAEGIVAIRAAEDIAAGKSFDEVVANATTLMAKSRVYFIVETLEYLHKGGRIGRAQAFLGGLLNVRPILGLENGEVHPKARERTRAKAMEKVVSLTAEYAQGRPLGHACVLHAIDPEGARQLGQLVESRFTLERPLIYSEIGPVIGTYVGPGALGLTFHCD